MKINPLAISLTGLLLCFIPLFVYNQHVEKVWLEGDKDQQLSFLAHTPFNALSVSVPDSLFGKLAFRAQGVSYVLTKDEHVQANDNWAQSKLIFFDIPVDSLEVIGLSAGSQLALSLIRLPRFSHMPQEAQPTNDCELPPIIWQDEWRSGLPEPDYERIYNEVNHIVIHHSATSNNVINYFDLVRSIYTYHTQVNGWSDIGYNYLVAPDGSIFAGRDPGLTMEQDAVLGAHFCASNTGTMGICLLGTFMDKHPGEDALHALTRLLSWKTAKDSLYPLGSGYHPQNHNLPVIAGHRDGCSTLCPGDSLYHDLLKLRYDCNEQLHQCGVYLLNETVTSKPLVRIINNPVKNGMIFLETMNQEIDGVSIINHLGQQQILNPVSVNGRYHNYSMSTHRDGIYLLRITAGGKHQVVRIMKSH